jgi:sulfide dehydrogenase cytochrome subunit
LVGAIALSLIACRAFAANDPSAEALADACTSCHGVAGLSHGYIPSLAGLSRNQLVRALLEYREQKSPATIMNRIARTYTDQEIGLLADYFSSRPKQP